MLSLSACSEKSANTETTKAATQPTAEAVAPTMHATVISVNGSSSVRFGNFETTIPTGFKVLSVADNTLSIGSEDGECVIGIFAADISMLTEELAAAYVPTMYETFATEGAVRTEGKQMDGIVGPFDVKYDLYAEESSDIGSTINIDTALTDSWYCYMIMMRCNSGSGKTSEYTNAFAEFFGYAEYIGGTPRFEFVQ